MKDDSAIDQIVDEIYSVDLVPLHEWVDTMHDRLFGHVFEQVDKIYESMKSSSHPITDAELEWVITMLPLELYSAAESLNKLRLDKEVMKLKNRKKDEMESTYSKEDKQLAAAAYSALVTRVENEISFAKELIMGCKKVWDSRRKAEQTNPISEVVPTPKLPDYPSTYIK